jgi:hypothetical protein
MLNELDLKPPVCTLVRIASGRLSNSIAMQHATNLRGVLRQLITDITTYISAVV